MQIPTMSLAFVSEQYKDLYKPHSLPLKEFVIYFTELQEDFLFVIQWVKVRVKVGLAKRAAFSVKLLLKVHCENSRRSKLS